MRTIFIISCAWLLVVRGAQAQGLPPEGAGEAAAAPAPVVVQPKLLESVEAEYPAEARSQGLEARVRLRLRIDAQGNVTEAEVMEPVGHGFDEAARAAALRFRFEPAMRDGVVKPSRLVYVHEFRLPRQSPPPPEASTATQELASGAEELGPIEISVQGETEAERRRQSAESVRVVETERLQRETADMGEALARTEGVGVRRAGGLGSRARFSLAGLTDDQIRFFIDGIPLELAGFGPGLANVPVNLVERVELYQGVVPIRFGTDALGGAVQLVTDRSVYGTGAAASYELGSFDTQRFTAGVRHLHTPTGFLVRANGFLDDTRNDYPIDIRAADAQGRLVPTRVPRFHDAYRAGGAGVEAGFVERPWARRLLLRVFGGGHEKELQHNPTMTVPYGEVDHGEVLGGATLRFEQTFFERLSVDAVAGYTWRQTRFTDVGACAYDWFGRCVQELPQPGEMESRAVERYVNQHTGFARLNLEWNLSALHTLRLAVAPTVVGRSGEDVRMRARQEADPLTGERNLFSLVGGLEYELDALDGRLESIAFLKDYVQLARAEKLLGDGTFARLDQDTHGVGVGNSTRFRFYRELYAKASYEWATRLPRPDELFGDGVLINENLSLKPELSHNLNLGLELESWRTPVGDFRGNVTGFGRLAEQLFLLIGQENYFTWQNVYAARSLGAAAAAGWTSPGQYLVLDGNVTWQDFRNVSDEGTFGSYQGQRIPNRPYLQAHGSARFQLTDLIRPGDELSLTWHTRYVHTFFRSWEGAGLKDSKKVIPSQLLHSLGLTYVIRNAPTTLSWTIDVQNLTDALAFDFYGVQRPGRSLFAKLTVDLGG